jgi:tetratricopeptide (TPR) repeat protein
MLAANRRLVAGQDIGPHVGAWFDLAVAYLAQCTGDLVEALKHFESAAQSFGDAGDGRNRYLHLCNAGSAYMGLGAYQQAADILQGTLPVLESMRLPFVLAGAHGNLGLALARLGDLDGALASTTIAVASCKEYGYRRFESASRVYLAETLARRGNPGGAEAQLRKAIAAAEGLPDSRAVAQAALADLLLGQQHVDEAFRLAKEAMDTLETLDAVEESEALIRLVWVLALRATGRRRAAGAQLAAARWRLEKQAQQIADPALRRTFLDAIPENARTRKLAEE